MLHATLGVVGTPFGDLDELARLSLENPPNLTATATAPAVLHTAEGAVTGTTVAGVPASRSVSRFGNVPYATPPQRWRAPEPPKPYPGGTLDGTSFGPTCVQPNGSGSEDCLQLNIFAPAQAVGKPNASLPVLVWIHGGAYQTGAAPWYDATNLVAYLDGRASVVTINYRLNVHGFLGSRHLAAAAMAAGDGSASTGNYGLLDQRRALAWVAANAPRWGGDPKRLTIFGESAGGGSISAHLASPGSAGLYAGAIIESGSFGTWTARPMAHAETVYDQVLEATACADAACLSTRSTANLTAAINAIPAGLCCTDVEGKAYIPWSPTIDGVVLADHPYKLALAGNLSRVPILHGTNLDEGASFESLGKDVRVAGVDAAWQKRYGPAMGPRTAPEMTALFLDNVTYPNVGPLGSRGWWAAQRSLTDQSFACGARALSASLGALTPVFQYLFTPATIKVRAHGSEVPYVVR